MNSQYPILVLPQVTCYIIQRGVMMAGLSCAGNDDWVRKTTTYIHHIFVFLLNIEAKRKWPEKWPTFSTGSFNKKIFASLFKFYWSLILSIQLMIDQHWFRWWIGTNRGKIFSVNLATIYINCNFLCKIQVFYGISISWLISYLFL